MSKIHITILLVLLMAVTVIGGYLVLVVEKTPDPRFIPAVAFIPTSKINTGSKVPAIRGKVANYNFNKRKKKSSEQAYPAPENDKSSLPSIAGGVRSVKSSPAVGANYSYNSSGFKSVQTVSGSSMEGMGALGLLASGSKKTSGEANVGGSSSSMPTSLANTTLDTPILGDRELARGGNGKGGGHPGGDPDTPVGDGLWILLLLAIGYVGRRIGLLNPPKGGL